MPINFEPSVGAGDTGGGGSPPEGGGVALSDAIGFVTEFNENVQIFNGAAEIVQGAAALVIAGLIEVAQLR